MELVEPRDARPDDDCVVLHVFIIRSSPVLRGRAGRGKAAGRMVAIPDHDLIPARLGTEAFPLPASPVSRLRRRLDGGGGLRGGRPHTIETVETYRPTPPRADTSASAIAALSPSDGDLSPSQRRPPRKRGDLPCGR